MIENAFFSSGPSASSMDSDKMSRPFFSPYSLRMAASSEVLSVEFHSFIMSDLENPSGRRRFNISSRKSNKKRTMKTEINRLNVHHHYYEINTKCKVKGNM